MTGASEDAAAEARIGEQDEAGRAGDDGRGWCASEGTLNLVDLLAVLLLGGAFARYGLGFVAGSRRGEA